MAQIRLASIVPHWILCVALLVVSSLVLLIETHTKAANTLVASDVQCSIEKPDFDGNKIAGMYVMCAGREVEVYGGKFLISLLKHNTSSVVCARLYDDDSVEDCKE